MSDDVHHMRHALRLAGRALGSTGAHPAVGCVIVGADGAIVGRGWTQPGGRPHAEAVALEQAGDAARGATVYVTFEPCCNQGSLPCADALTAAGVARVVVAMEDPDRRVSGRGLARLRNAGIAVDVGTEGEGAAQRNAGYLMRVREGRPLVTLKILQSLDGRVATSFGEGRWLSGELSRLYGQMLRARHDAILIGAETALADDPELTCCIPGLEHRSPIRVVLDSRLRLSANSKLARTAKEFPTIVFATDVGGGPLVDCGIDVVHVPKDARGRPDIASVLRTLAERGVTRLLVEGGASVYASCLDRNLVDQLELFSAPVVLGGAGHAAVGALAALSPDEVPRFRRIARRELGADLLESFAASA